MSQPEDEKSSVDPRTLQNVWGRHYPYIKSEEIDFTNLGSADELFFDTVTKFPVNLAIELFQLRITYRELADFVNRFSSSLCHLLGIVKGDRISICLPNTPQFVIAFLAILKIGGVVVPISPYYTRNELEFILRDSGSKVIICYETFHDMYKKLAGNNLVKFVVSSHNDFSHSKNAAGILSEKGRRHDLYLEKNVFRFMYLARQDIIESQIRIKCSDDPAVHIYTSGTTSYKKGVILTHQNLLANLLQTQEMIKGKLTDGMESVVAVVPFYHIYGMTTVMQFGLASGYTLVLFPRINIKEILEMIECRRITLLFTVPSLIAGIVDYLSTNKNDLSSLKLCFCGGDKLREELNRKFKTLTGLDLVEGYGLTEASPLTHANPYNRIKVGSMGIPIPNTLSWVIDPQTLRFLRPGEAGELVISGPQVMNGYWNLPEENTFTLFTANGLRWLRTGDIATIDNDGYFFFVERKKDIIKYKGLTIFPLQIENVLYSSGKLKMAVVLGIPQSQVGEEVVAVVVPKDEFNGHVSETEIINVCKNKLASYMVPKRVMVRDHLPLTSNGKVLKRQLREELRRE